MALRATAAAGAGAEALSSKRTARGCADLTAKAHTRPLGRSRDVMRIAELATGTFLVVDAINGLLH
jgi:hypothetical protein